ncbi:SURF1 family protein [Vibrio hepatarius]|uniref:SURF1 family protein n=1 Tax=Vibrio hepatarius TaxID=171383 RepID=UPI00142E5094|nr:SURF1 family protein [Vibrio hepatarius]NIY82305.1 SURF1 family protein [Vibrio hepatarius]
MNTIWLSFVGLSKKPTFWLGVLLTVVVFSVLINLGLWQLSRADEKQQLEQRLSERESAAMVPLAEIEVAKFDYLTGLRVEGIVRPMPSRYLLLDNQTHEGKVGYLAYQLVALANGKHVLLERGFVTAGGTRSHLPKVEWLQEPLDIQARLYQRSTNPLSDELMLEQGVPSRIQNLNVVQLSSLWRVDIEPYVLQPINKPWPYPQPWVPIPLSSAKHFGYAVQWFSMAVVLVILSLWVLYRALRKGVHHE